MDIGLVNQLSGYYDRAKQRAETRNKNFESIKNDIKGIKNEELKDNSKSFPKTLEQLKKEIYDIINSTPITGLAGSNIVINITDDAFERMLNDEEFMKTQVGALIRDLSWPPTPMYNPEYVVFEINGAQGYRGSSFGSTNKSIFDIKTKDDFWSKRSEKKKKYQKEMEEYYKKKYEEKCVQMKAKNEYLSIMKNKNISNLSSFYEKNFLRKINLQS